jgi:hypothetical protein
LNSKATFADFESARFQGLSASIGRFKNSAATAGIISLAEKDRQPSDPKDRRM